LSKNSQLDISAQQAALDVWKKKWESHPAANNLPKDLFALQTAATHQPQKLALLLPMQGRLSEAGDAVRDGFFAAYYQQNPATQSLPSVRLYDTTKGAVNAYQTAVSDGAELIIGPLDKDDVNQISKLPNLTVPLLSLNYPDQAPAQALNNFYQFGLAVEDEARQTARYAIQQGYTRALVIAAPQDVSERSTQAFVNEWQKLGGIVVSKATFTTPDSFSQSIKELMLADQSQARATLLQQQLGTKMEFTPRARTDIDMIFMAVSPSQGRQIKPIFAFHNANDIPTFATSSIYSGDADATNNDDLNDIIFSTLPWLFETNIQKQTLSKNSKSANIYGRLQALGIDAFHLYSRLAQLQQSPEIQIYGATGALHLLTNGRIEREQIWAHFNNGIAEPLSASAKATNMQTTQP
jgi:outer membrane PBP1 activator LpoA protein